MTDATLAAGQPVVTFEELAAAVGEEGRSTPELATAASLIREAVAVGSITRVDDGDESFAPVWIAPRGVIVALPEGDEPDPRFRVVGVAPSQLSTLLAQLLRLGPRNGAQPDEFLVADSGIFEEAWRRAQAGDVVGVIEGLPEVEDAKRWAGDLVQLCRDVVADWSFELAWLGEDGEENRRHLRFVDGGTSGWWLVQPLPSEQPDDSKVLVGRITGAHLWRLITRFHGL